MPGRAPSAVGSDQLSASWKALADDDARALAAAERIGRAAAALCPGGGLPGFSAAMLPDAPARQASAARAAYGAASSGVVVAAVTPGGAAERAGIRRGLVVTRIGEAVAPGDMDRIWSVIRAARAGTVLEIADGGGRTYRIVPQPGCAFPVVVDTARGLAAASSASRIRVTSALVRFAAAPGELETIVAHEAAHMLLCHHRRGRPLAEREAAADRLSAALLYDARIDFAAAEGFWQRFGERRGILDLVDIGHGSASERIARMRSAYAAATQGSRPAAGDSDCPAPA